MLVTCLRVRGLYGCTQLKGHVNGEMQSVATSEVC